MNKVTGAIIWVAAAIMFHAAVLASTDSAIACGLVGLLLRKVIIGFIDDDDQ